MTRSGTAWQQPAAAGADGDGPGDAGSAGAGVLCRGQELGRERSPLPGGFSELWGKQPQR